MVAFELGYASPAFRSVIGTNNGIGSQGHHRRWHRGAEDTTGCRAWRAGAVIGSFALDRAGCRIGRRLGEDHGRSGPATAIMLNGTKRYITNAPVADVFTVMARTGGPGASGRQRLRRAAKDSRRPQPRSGRQEDGTARHPHLRCDLRQLPRCRPTAVIGGVEGVGFKTAMKVLNRGRLHIAAVCTGCGGAAVRRVPVSFARVRACSSASRSRNTSWSRPCWPTARRKPLPGAPWCVEAARQLRQPASGSIQQAASAKLFCSEMVGRVADRAVQIHGGAGYMQDYPVEHFYRDVRLFRLYEGTSQIQQIIIAREMLNAEA
jgi:acyl-CoA dehydrogenase